MSRAGGTAGIAEVVGVAALVTSVAAAVVAARGVLGLGLGTTLGGVALVATLAVMAGVLVRGRGLEDLAIGLLALGLATSTWNAVAVGPLKVTHVALGLAGLVLAAVALTSRRPVRAPFWVWVLGGTIALVAALT